MLFFTIFVCNRYNKHEMNDSVVVFFLENLELQLELVLAWFCRWFESRRIWAAGLVVSELCDEPSHFSSQRTLHDWMLSEGIPGIKGIDTRQLTKIIREKGTLLGRIRVGDDQDESAAGITDWVDPNQRNLVQEVSVQVKNNRKKRKSDRLT